MVEPPEPRRVRRGPAPPEGQMSWDDIHEAVGADEALPPPPPPPRPPAPPTSPDDDGNENGDNDDGSAGDNDETGMFQREGQSDTSKEAADWISDKSGKLRLRVLWAIRHSRDRGLTDEEGYTLLGMAANTWRPRRVELHKGWKDFDGGYVQKSGRKRKTVAGRSAIVWVATEKGRRA